MVRRVETLAIASILPFQTDGVYLSNTKCSMTAIAVVNVELPAIRGGQTLAIASMLQIKIVFQINRQWDRA